MRLMNEDFPTFGIPTIIRRIGAPTMPAFCPFSISGFSSWLRTIGTNCLMPFPVLQSSGRAKGFASGSTAPNELWHSGLPYLPYSGAAYEVSPLPNAAFPDSGCCWDSGIQNFYHSIHQRQIRRNHPACFVICPETIESFPSEFQTYCLLFSVINPAKLEIGANAGIAFPIIWSFCNQTDHRGNGWSEECCRLSHDEIIAVGMVIG